jgi:hypothetical protein
VAKHAIDGLDFRAIPPAYVIATGKLLLWGRRNCDGANPDKTSRLFTMLGPAAPRGAANPYRTPRPGFNCNSAT